MRRKITIALWFVGSVWLITNSAVVAEESIPSIEAQAIAAAEKVDAVSAKMRINTLVKMGDADIESESNGTYEHQRHGNRIVFRIDLNNVVTSRHQGQTRKAEQTVLTISDGSACYVITTQVGRKPTVTKSIAQPGQNIVADENFFTSLKKSYDLRVLPDQNIEGKKAWVIEATPKAASDDQPAKTIHYIQKESGLRVKSTGHDKTGRRIQLTALSQINLKPDIKPDRFLVELPDDVTIVDMTGK